MSVVSLPAGRPATEVTAKAKRRRFTAEEKRRVLQAAAACTQRGELGALLRREGLYSSHLMKWREQAERGEIVGLNPEEAWPGAEGHRRARQAARRAAASDRQAHAPGGTRGGDSSMSKKNSHRSLGIALPPIDDESE